MEDGLLRIGLVEQSARLDNISFMLEYADNSQRNHQPLSGFQVQALLSCELGYVDVFVLAQLLEQTNFPRSTNCSGRDVLVVDVGHGALRVGIIGFGDHVDHL